MTEQSNDACSAGEQWGVFRCLSRMGLMTAGAVLSLTLFILTFDQSFAAQRFVVMGTGGVTGVYFPAGGALCRVVNNQRRDHGIRCSVEATAGSVYNIGAVVSGDLDFAIVQSDVQYQAYFGEGPYKNQAHPDLRALFSLHVEAFTVVAREGTGIRGLQDLAGKRVNIGNPGSGQRNMMEAIMKSQDWTLDSFDVAAELPSRDQAQALCDGRVDAIVFMVGHPNASIREALIGCDSYIVPITGPRVAEIMSADRNFGLVAIDQSLYGQDGQPVPTFGGLATVVTSSSVDENVVYAVIKAIFSDLEGVKVQHDALSRLQAESMIVDGLTAPLHAGAEKYYREIGLIN